MVTSWLRRVRQDRRERALAEHAGRQPCPEENIRPGECNICGSEDGFCFSEAYHSRDNFTCRVCSCTARDRMLIKTLGECLGLLGALETWPTQALTLLETSGYRATPTRLARKFRYINLMYESSVRDGVRGDLSRLCLSDDSLDVVLSADVFEHVRDDESAWREVYRVLKPGGYLVLQVPALGELESTEVRVEVRDGEDVHLMEPEFHAENTLVYRKYGADLLEKLSSLGFAVLHRRAAYRRHRIGEQSIVVAQKAPQLTMGPRDISERAWT